MMVLLLVVVADILEDGLLDFVVTPCFFDFFNKDIVWFSLSRLESVSEISERSC